MRMTEEDYQSYQQRMKAMTQIGKQHGLPGPKPKRSKYGNHKVSVDGMTFDSKREYQRYCELQMLEKAGKIEALQRQVAFDLLPAVTINGKTKRAVKYVCDFFYKEDGKEIIEDVKSQITSKNPLFRLKAHILMYVHGRQIKEVY